LRKEDIDFQVLVKYIGYSNKEDIEYLNPQDYMEWGGVTKNKIKVFPIL
jgi:hypothetical protein